MSQFLVNSQGHHVPEHMVKEVDKLEDQMVNTLAANADNLSRTLADFKDRVFKDVDAFMDLLAEKYKVSKGGKKGNLTLLSYDGLTKIQIAIADNLQFGPELRIAKDLIDECIKDWGKDSNDNIRVLIEHAFRTDKNNRVNTKAILGLRSLNIQDEQWKRAMDAITESVKVVSSKQYVRFYRRKGAHLEWESITLDIAAV